MACSCTASGEGSSKICDCGLLQMPQLNGTRKALGKIGPCLPHCTLNSMPPQRGQSATGWQPEKELRLPSLLLCLPQGPQAQVFFWRPRPVCAAGEQFCAAGALGQIRLADRSVALLQACKYLVRSPVQKVCLRPVGAT